MIADHDTAPRVSNIACSTVSWSRCLPRSALGDAIPAIVLKGAALADTIYPSIAHRPMNDIDLLVRGRIATAAGRRSKPPATGSCPNRGSGSAPSTRSSPARWGSAGAKDPSSSCTGN